VITAVVTSCNGNGKVMPLFIFKGTERGKTPEFCDEVPHGTLVEMLEWHIISELFIPSGFSIFISSGHVVILLDGDDTHINNEAQRQTAANFYTYHSTSFTSCNH
jgi:hypothetical protein